ncbi:hypothetical protein [Agrilutibacter solisilvae]|uniref:Uncharacterized protein n=1 Tax=Agrilutibacter solisilvae TaxID=2763317 RepID=A0A974XW46_9GAMM|nr:hypothetical protein [Lysobacter solisilvae]QSX76979.1 hypothetical protein I8J32_009105 [Lysobacter solisilvae]
MKRSLLLGPLIALATFPALGQSSLADLSARVDAGDAAAFQQVVALAQTTPPGESLEDLAQIASHFVRVDPAAFLRAQTPGKPCFGVSFMGPDFLDNPAARAHERSLRRAALESVPESSLSAVKQQCLAELR